DEARPAGHGTASLDTAGFRHGEGNCRSAGSPWTAEGDRLAEDDEHILETLAYVVQASGQPSFGILTNTLSVAEQLDFGYKLISLAGRIRARVEKVSVDHRYRTADGGAP
ncbi:MAG: hypothetical protein LC775_09865, partial [Acidobacteria bacterium]|nr:hypothetical protein [Acidobacteriota bacterium]